MAWPPYRRIRRGQPFDEAVSDPRPPGFHPGVARNTYRSFACVDVRPAPEAPVIVSVETLGWLLSKTNTLLDVFSWFVDREDSRAPRVGDGVRFPIRFCIFCWKQLDHVFVDC